MVKKHDASGSYYAGPASGWVQSVGVNRKRSCSVCGKDSEPVAGFTVANGTFVCGPCWRKAKSKISVESLPKPDMVKRVALEILADMKKIVNFGGTDE